MQADADHLVSLFASMVGRIYAAFAGASVSLHMGEFIFFCMPVVAGSVLLPFLFVFLFAWYCRRKLFISFTDVVLFAPPG